MAVKFLTAFLNVSVGVALIKQRARWSVFSIFALLCKVVGQNEFFAALPLVGYACCQFIRQMSSFSATDWRLCWAIQTWKRSRIVYILFVANMRWVHVQGWGPLWGLCSLHSGQYVLYWSVIPICINQGLCSPCQFHLGFNPSLFLGLELVVFLKVH